jgi:hypothetical protein
MIAWPEPLVIPYGPALISEARTYLRPIEIVLR